MRVSIPSLSTYVDFPDGMAPEAIQSAIDANWDTIKAGAVQKTEAKPIPKMTSTLVKEKRAPQPSLEELGIEAKAPSQREPGLWSSESIKGQDYVSMPEAIQGVVQEAKGAIEKPMTAAVGAAVLTHPATAIPVLGAFYGLDWLEGKALGEGRTVADELTTGGLTREAANLLEFGLKGAVAGGAVKGAKTSLKAGYDFFSDIAKGIADRKQKVSFINDVATQAKETGRTPDEVVRGMLPEEEAREIREQKLATEVEGLKQQATSAQPPVEKPIAEPVEQPAPAPEPSPVAPEVKETATTPKPPAETQPEGKIEEPDFEQIGKDLGGISHLGPMIQRSARAYYTNGPEAGRALLEMEFERSFERLDGGESSLPEGAAFDRMIDEYDTAIKQRLGIKSEEKPPFRVYHFTKEENIPVILDKGFDTSKPPIHGTGALQKRDYYTAGDKVGKDVLYFTTDKDRWNKVEIYVGEGKGNQDYTYFDYDKQKFVTEKNARQTVDLAPIEADIKANSKILTLDSYKSYMDFQKKNLGRAYIMDALDDVVNKAKDLGYDVLNIKHKEGTWEHPEGKLTKRGEKDWYQVATGASGKDDYFILNRDVLDVVTKGEKKPIETDPARVQEIKNSITEGEMILKSGKTISGRKMSKTELDAVQRSVDNAKQKIGESAPPDASRLPDRIGKVFQEGWDAGNAENNPHISSSPLSDAYTLGAYAKEHGLLGKVRKTKGYTWVIGDESYRVEGSKVTPTTPKESITGQPGFSPAEDFTRRPVSSGTAQETPQKRSDIVKFLEEKLDVPIRTGKFRQKALGIYKGREEVVRSKYANDVETIAHEVGHGLQKYLFPDSVHGKGGKYTGYTKDPFIPFRGELEPIATKTLKNQPKTTEGFAEFIRLYVTDEKKARQVAPKFYAYFEDLLDDKAPGTKEILLDARAQFDRWVTQTPLQRIIGTISNEPEKPKTSTWDALRTATLDELHPLKAAVQEMVKGKDLPVSEDPYKLARLMPGWMGKPEAFLEHKTFDYSTYQWKGKSLKDILTPVKDNLDELKAYMKARRAVELHKRGIQTGIDPKDALSVTRELDSKYGKVFDELTQYQDDVLTYFRDAGMLSKDAYDSFKRANKDYVPFYRVMESGKVGPSAGRGLEANQPIKGIKGSWRDTIDPVESIIKNTYALIQVAEKNGVVKALVDIGRKNEGLGKYIERIPSPMQKITVQPEEIARSVSELLGEAGIEAAELKDIPFEALDIFRPSAFVPKENVISYWNKGKRELYQVHPDIAKAIQALDRESTNCVLKILSYPSRWLRAGATLTPEFIARNPFRDQFSAFVYSKYGFIPGVDLGKGIAHMVKADDLYWKWKISGGEHSMLVSLDRDYLQKTEADLLKGHDIAAISKTIIKNPLRALQILSELTEEGTRIGEFAKGIKKEGATKEGIQQAGLASREVTLDFNRMGAKTKNWNMLVAFWNANVQSMDKMIREFKKNPAPTVLKTTAAITLPSIVLTAINIQDPRYKEIPRWQKDLFWIVMTKDHIWRIPKPFELGILFGTVPERITEAILTKNPHAFDHLINSMGSGVLPGAFPTIMLPLMENWANKSWFLDRKIVPEGKEDLPPEYQYQPYTSELAKGIGKVISKIPAAGETSAASPAKIENLIRGWSGGLGMHAVTLVDAGLRKAGVLPDEVKPSKTLSDIPVIKAFSVRFPSADAESISTFFDTYQEADAKLKAARTLAQKEGKVSESRKLLEGTVRLQGVYKALMNQRKVVDSVYANPSLNADDKRRLIDETYMQMIEIAREGNKALDAIKDREASK